MKTAAFNAEPYVFVVDIAKATEFYVKRLGFEIAISDGEPPHFVQLVRSGARLNLRKVDRAVLDPARVEAEELLSAAITVQDIGSLYAEFAAAEVPFFQRLHTASWGARTFIVRDQEGNLVMFAG